MRGELPKWHDHNAKANPPFLALAKARDIAVREGWCFHVQAIIVAIDQYAEAAIGNRQYFQNPLHSVGARKAGDIGPIPLSANPRMRHQRAYRVFMRARTNCCLVLRSVRRGPCANHQDRGDRWQRWCRALRGASHQALEH